jgi:flagellar hook assembly protein FlgD
MKNVRFILGIAIAGAVALAVNAGQASAQLKQGPFVTQTADRLSKLIGEGNKAGYSLSDNVSSIGGGWLKQSTSDWIPLYYVNLTGGKTYRFVAAGDNDAKDVDIELLDANNKVVAQDTGAEPTAKIEHTPDANGKYLVRIRLYASREDLPCVCMTVMMTKKK